MPYIIAVDLGGTNCRFAGFTLENGVLALHRTERRATATLPDTDALLAACETLLERRRVRARHGRSRFRRPESPADQRAP